MVHYYKQQINSCVQGGKQSQAVRHKEYYHSNSSETQIHSKFHTDYLHSGTMRLETFQKQTQLYMHTVLDKRGIVTTNNRERDK